MTKKEKNMNNGWQPHVMTPEEALAFLDSKGIKYEICDTPVPVLANKVNCGVPLDSGEQMIDGYYYLPKSVVGLNPMLTYGCILLDIADRKKMDYDELILEKRGTTIWMHFAVKPRGNRRYVDF